MRYSSFKNRIFKIALILSVLISGHLEDFSFWSNPPACKGMHARAPAPSKKKISGNIKWVILKSRALYRNKKHAEHGSPRICNTEHERHVLRACATLRVRMRILLVRVAICMYTFRTLHIIGTSSHMYVYCMCRTRSTLAWPWPYRTRIQAIKHEKWRKHEIDPWRKHEIDPRTTQKMGKYSMKYSLSFSVFLATFEISKYSAETLNRRRMILVISLASVPIQLKKRALHLHLRHISESALHT